MTFWCIHGRKIESNHHVYGFIFSLLLLLVVITFGIYSFLESILEFTLHSDLLSPCYTIDHWYLLLASWNPSPYDQNIFPFPRPISVSSLLYSLLLRVWLTVLLNIRMEARSVPTASVSSFQHPWAEATGSAFLCLPHTCAQWVLAQCLHNWKSFLFYNIGGKRTCPWSPLKNIYKVIFSHKLK